ncbi:sulfite exporter TauE/SafE family protein [Comamonas sp. Y6]|uniref:Probable membrane transporter protein n=1 Tax=Comamonas resistens TaxID=3046670 RepID=A0ABY8SU28_9BURK|nr:sulfite exporter TauE/SafE family protein [Comamonas resistens]MDL5037282.1 sulfite exporter TauE/SafE family protein [Comamonas resistens]WHS65419.1 sulfite exporter TauE/SafE family protein [Comamonas resistens]
MQLVFFVALVALASFCQNLTGFAFGLIFVGVAGATHLMDIADAANVACLLSIVNGVSYMRAYRFEADWSLLKPMLISSVLGVIAGVFLLHWLSGNALSGLRMLLGVVIVLCALLLLTQKKALAQPSGPGALWFAGVSSGLLGGLFATPGPPMVYHLYRQPMDRMLVRHCLFAMFVTCSVLRAVMVAAEGQLNWAVFGWTALAFPVVTGVTWWSARHPPALPRKLVEWLVCGLLVLSGLSLLWSGFRAGQPGPVVPDDTMALASSAIRT